MFLTNIDDKKDLNISIKYYGENGNHALYIVHDFHY